MTGSQQGATDIYQKSGDIEMNTKVQTKEVQKKRKKSMFTNLELSPILEQAEYPKEG